jgi:hypothetical protein
MFTAILNKTTIFYCHIISKQSLRFGSICFLFQVISPEEGSRCFRNIVFVTMKVYADDVNMLGGSLHTTRWFKYDGDYLCVNKSVCPGHI